jgi:hypothetical protein
VVSTETAPKISETMKTKKDESDFWQTLRKRFRRRPKRHDPMLVLNMSDFNFTDGWRWTFFKGEYGRSSA